jgi:FAD synthetase
MSLGRLVSNYIASAELVLGEIEIPVTLANLDQNGVEKVLEHAKAYLEDAKHYREKERFDVSLASVAYCEGLLDALKLLGAVRFEWPRRKEEEK